MKNINVTRRRLENGAFVKRFALETDCPDVVREDCRLVLDGRTIVYYARLPFENTELAAALNALKFNQNERTGGLKTLSRIFGFMPRVTLRADFCKTASMAYDFPYEHNLICEFGQKLAPIYEREFPELYAKHLALAEKVLPQYRIPRTPFTSGIANKNNTLKYHYDAGNFEEVASCMVAFRQNVQGGGLALPEFGLQLEIADNTLLIFDGQSILHGVTPILESTPPAYRYSLVYYSLKQMWKCLPMDKELARIRNLRTERELKRAGAPYPKNPMLEPPKEGT